MLQLDNPEDVFVFAAEASKLTPPSPEPEAESLIDKIVSCCRVFTFADADADEHPVRERSVGVATRSGGTPLKRLK